MKKDFRDLFMPFENSYGYAVVPPRADPDGDRSLRAGEAAYPGRLLRTSFIYWEGVLPVT